MKRQALGIIIFIVSFTLGSLITPLAAYYVGMIEAQLDISQGKLRSKRCTDVCIRWSPMKKYEARLKADYGIEPLYEDSCMTSAVKRQRVSGYNEVQRSRIEALYGKGVLERVIEELQQEHIRELAEQR